MFHFYTPRKHRETEGFLFPGDIEVEHWLQLYLISTIKFPEWRHNVLLAPLLLILGGFQISFMFFFHDNSFIVICLQFK